VLLDSKCIEIDVTVYSALGHGGWLLIKENTNFYSSIKMTILSTAPVRICSVMV
jgi:hypothetical protein